MVEQDDAKEVGTLPEPAGEDAILLARGGITGGMIVRTDPGGGVHQNQRLEYFSRMHDGQGQRTDRDDVDPDDVVFRIEPADQEVFAVQPGKERPENVRSTDRGLKRKRRRYGTV